MSNRNVAMEGEEFVPNGTGDYSRSDLAILLIGTAQEFGIDKSSIRSTSTGFFIPQALADVLYDDGDEEPEPAPKKATSTKKTSGNRAAKTGTDKE